MKKSNPTPRLKPVLPETPSLIPWVNFNEYDAFVDIGGQIMDIMQIPCKDLKSSKEYDVLFDMYGWMWFYKSYMDDVKIITMNFPVDTYQQAQHISSIMEETKNPIFLDELQKEKEWLLAAHESYDAREYYLMFFSKDVDQYKKNLNRIATHLGRSRQVEKLRLGKKIQILFKMYNMNASLAATPETRNIPRDIPGSLKYNPYLLSSVQPCGGLSCRDERLVKKGDGYEACIHVYGYPSTVSFNWLSKLTLFANSVVTIDIGASDRLKTVDSISKSIEEQASRFTEARYETDKFNAQRVYSQLEQLHERIMSVGEVVKQVHVRIFLYAPTQNGLEDVVSKTIAEIESAGYKASIFLDENPYEWKSLSLSISQQKTLANGRSGNGIPAETMALGHPYHFAALMDPFGTYYGYTKTNGTVILDPYHKDKQRLSYCWILLGVPRSGKSTFLKNRLKKDIIQNNYIRGFATNNEFDRVVRYLGGSIINLDGTDGFLNVLHVYKTDEKEVGSFIRHVEKVCQFYKYLVPEADTYDLAALQEVVRILYMRHMGYDITNEDSNVDGAITGRDPKEYPIFSDLLRVLHDEMYEDARTRKRRRGVSDERFSRYEKIELMLTNTVTTLGHIFNGHSSIRDFRQEQIVFFSVEGVMAISPQVFEAQVYSGMSLLSDNMMAVGAPQKAAFDRGELKIEDIRKYMIIMDEAHNYVNARKPNTVAYLDHFIRESQKFFAGILFATHKINDFLPLNSSAAGIDAMHNLFSLAQYKVLFRQSSDSLEALKQAFGEDLPGNDLEDLPKFEQGECILSISGVSAVRFYHEVSEEDINMFTGGA